MLYLGFRIEIAKYSIQNYDIKKIKKKFNAKYKNVRMLDLYVSGKIIVKRIDSLIIAGGKKERATGLANFALLQKSNIKIKEIIRIAEIVNVLGNGRLIRERVKTFVDKKSMLNNIPELDVLRDAFINLNKIMPVFVNNAWYYAPEIK